MINIIKNAKLLMLSSLLLVLASAQLSADTYVYQTSGGLTLLTDKKVSKKGYKLQRVYKEKRYKKRSNGSKSSSGKPRKNRIGCGKLSAERIDQKTRPYLGHINKYSKQYGVDENLVRAIIRQESCFKPKAKSRVGAMGLMQLMPGTAEYLGIKNAWNPEQNIRGGVKYIHRQLKRFSGDIRLALAAYNAGPGAVLKYDGIPPYKETQNYVGSIMEEYGRLQKHRSAIKVGSLSKKSKLPDDFHIFWSKQ